MNMGGVGLTYSTINTVVGRYTPEYIIYMILLHHRFGRGRHTRGSRENINLQHSAIRTQKVWLEVSTQRHAAQRLCVCCHRVAERQTLGRCRPLLVNVSARSSSSAHYTCPHVGNRNSDLLRLGTPVLCLRLASSTLLTQHGPSTYFCG